MIGHAQGELLAQVQGAVTAATLLTAADLKIEITLILAVVSRTAGGAITFDLFQDDDGTTYDDSTLIFAGQKSINDDPIVFQAQHPGSGIHLGPNGSIGGSCSVVDDITFSIYGITENIANDRLRSA
jgi:hypothetical protein